MTKREFLDELRKRLSDLNDADFEASVAYYEEMINDRMEDGLSEEDAVKEIGTPAEAASHILEEMSLSKIIKARLSAKSKLPIWAIVLLIVGAPVWVSLLVSAASVVISVYAVLWSAVISLWASVAAFGLSALASLIASPVLLVTGFGWTALASLGAALFLAGLAIFAFFGGFYSTKGICLLTKQIFLFIKRAFVRKEAVQ